MQYQPQPMQYQQLLNVSPVQNEPNNSLVSDVSHFEDDIEEQIEASTILLDNGQSKPQKITIKFRKERSGVTATTSFSHTVPSPVVSPPATKTPKQKKKKKRSSAKTATKPDVVHVDADEDDSQLLPPMLTSSNDSYTSAISTKASTKSKTKSSTHSKFEYGREEAPNRSWVAEFDDTDDENIATNGTATGTGVRFNFNGLASTPVRNNNNGAYRV